MIGVIEKLDYIVDIGVTAIWLTPFMKSPLQSGGYDITDYLDTQSVFGTTDDFKDLLSKAHKKSITLINLKIFYSTLIHLLLLLLLILTI